MIIVHACTMIMVHACTTIIVHAWTMIIVHACTMIIVHACTMIIVHVCIMIIVRACTMIHSTCMYYDLSTCMHYDHSTCIMPYWAHVRRGEGREARGGEAPWESSGLGEPLGPPMLRNPLEYIINRLKSIYLTQIKYCFLRLLPLCLDTA